MLVVANPFMKMKAHKIVQDSWHLPIGFCTMSASKVTRVFLTPKIPCAFLTKLCSF
jgi:hypothetical protein